MELSPMPRMMGKAMRAARRRLNQLNAGHLRHVVVGDQQMIIFGLERVPGGGAIYSSVHLVAGLGQQKRGDLAHAAVIIRHEDAMGWTFLLSPRAARIGWLFSLRDVASYRSWRGNRNWKTMRESEGVEVPWGNSPMQRSFPECGQGKSGCNASARKT